MREISVQEALNTIMIDRQAACSLFDLSPEVLTALETSGVVEFDGSGLATVTTLTRGVFTESCIIAFQCNGIVDTARTMSLAAATKIMAMVDFMKDRVPAEVLNEMVEHFVELGEIFEAAAPILMQKIGSQPQEVSNG